MSTSLKVIEILSRLKVEMNGAVTGAMEQGGLNYNLNYGVSAITVKRVAANYAPDHELALALYRQDVRELKLAALYIDNPSQVTPQQIENWSNDFRTSEMAMQAAMQLFWRVPQALQIAIEYLQVSAGIPPLNVLCALYMVGRMAKEGLLEEFEAEAITKLAIRILGQTIEQPGYIRQAAQYSLRELYATHSTLQQTIRTVDDAELQAQLDFI